MSESRRGTVWHGDRRVGRIREDVEGQLCVTYDYDWLHGGGFALSHSFPLSYAQDEVKAHHWFAGLLPEEDSRQQLRGFCENMRFSDERDATLLFSIARDCAGAFSILPDAIPPGQARAPYRPLSDEELSGLVHSKGKDLPAFQDGTVRFALAGAQRKLAVAYDNETYALSGYGRPSGHILKFETHKRVCVAEHLATCIAGAAGLPVVRTEYLARERRGKTVPYLRIERFDRERDNQGNLVLRHQEDMLQALGLPPAFKYQSQGGPSLRDIAALLRARALRPDSDIATLADWQMLNFLLGNWDGHAKNLALLYQPGAEAPSLAPFYDLVSIEYLNALGAHWDRDMGFWVGERNGPDRIRRQDWERLAEDLGMQPNRLLDRLEDFAARLPGITEQAVEDFIATHGEPQVHRQLTRTVQKRCRRLLGSWLAGRR